MRPPNTCLECDKTATGITMYCREHQRDNWHGWFAWYPVLTSQKIWVWGKTVLRKRVPAGCPRGYHQTYWYSVTDN